MKYVLDKRIKDLRIEKGLSQTQVAKSIEIPQQRLSKLELGQIEPDVATLAKLAIFYKVTADYLIGLENDY